MFNRRREIKVPPPPEAKSLADADAVLREHRSTIVKVKTILEREVEKIDRYLEGNA